MEITITCLMCHRQFTVTVDKEGYEAWRSGKAIQYALPKLSAAERELLISSICGDCFDRIFG